MAIQKEDIKKYWSERSSVQGARTVGFANSPTHIQDNNYKIRKEFIFKVCPKNLKTLDYGCGIGRYSKEFDNYLGVDVCENLINIAKNDNSEKEYFLVEEPAKIPDFFCPELFFTATVLQHNSDEVVEELFKNLSLVCKSDIYFSIYENSQANGKTIKSRSSKDYCSIISKYFKLHSDGNCRTHNIHGENHSHLFVCGKSL